MKKNFIFSSLVLLAALAGGVCPASAQVASQYCDRPTGHLNDPAFGDVNSHILLTISNIDDHSMYVQVSPRPGTSQKIDLLQVNIAGQESVIVGGNDLPELPEYKAIITFADTPPANVTLQILWSNPEWAGNWMIDGLIVPFAAQCGGEVTPPEEVDEIAIDNFESGINGWAPVNGFCDVRENPAKAGLNTSDNVLYMLRAADDAQFWTGAIRNPAFYNNIPRYLHVKMHRSNANRPILKISDNPPTEVRPMDNITMIAGEWQDVVFDLAGSTRLDFVMIMIDETATTAPEQVDLYIDDLLLNNDPAPRTVAGINVSTEQVSAYTLTALSQALRIAGLSGEAINIYTPNGKAVFAASPAVETIEIPLAPGLYLVKIGNVSYKVTLTR